MANVLHSAFTGASSTTHRMKGAASNNGVYVSTGTGTGDWRLSLHERVNYSGAGTFSITAPINYTKCLTGTPSNWSGVYFSRDESFPTGFIRKTDGKGVLSCRIWWSCWLSQDDATKRDIYLTFGTNGVPQTQWQVWNTAAQNTDVHVQGWGYALLDEGDYVELFAKVAAGDLTVNGFALGIEGWHF